MIAAWKLATLLLNHEVESAEGWEQWAASLDCTAAALSQVQVAKPRLSVAKYGFHDMPPKPDCVEVTCREIFDLLLYEPHVQRFVPARLPDTCANTGLLSFYKSQLGEADESELGNEWFRCVPRPVEYLSPNAGDLATMADVDVSGRIADARRIRASYELRPNLRNVARAVAYCWAPSSRQVE